MQCSPEQMTDLHQLQVLVERPRQIPTTVVAEQHRLVIDRAELLAQGPNAFLNKLVES